MLTSLVKIGNSRGVRIPKALLETARLSGPVEMTAQDGVLVIRPAARPRLGWAEAFRVAAKEASDASETPEPLVEFRNEFDEEEWEWR